MNQPRFIHNYKKLRLAQDLSNRTLENLSVSLMKISVDNVYHIPPKAEIVAYLNKLAKDKKINHYILKGVHEEVILFDPEDVINTANIFKVEAEKITEVVKIQCHNSKPKYSNDIPIEISMIKDLYYVPDTVLQSGTCIYFLCNYGKVVYVGKAENIHSRLIEHSKNKAFDSVYYIRVSANRMDKVETALIAQLQPKYNQNGMKQSNQKRAIAEPILNGS
tara:strand:+ start:73 stop:732 length:660 start_codon:yes stop_codon:yes gene_type:complete